MKRLISLARVVILTGLAALSVPAPASPAAQRYVVPIANMKYGRLPTRLKAGDTIVWVNRDSVPHTVTARNRSFDLRLNPGQSVPMKLSSPGGIAFYCLFHPAMRGTIVVGTN